MTSFAEVITSNTESKTKLSDLLEEHDVTALLVLSEGKRSQTSHFCNVMPGEEEIKWKLLWAYDKTCHASCLKGRNVIKWSADYLQYTPFNLSHRIVFSLLLRTVLNKFRHLFLHLNKIFGACVNLHVIEHQTCWREATGTALSSHFIRYTYTI